MHQNRSDTPAVAIRHVAILGNYLPRRCGIATFTTDLAQAITTKYPDVECAVVAMNDPGTQHAYPERVCFEIGEGDLPAYRRAADFLNVGTTDVLSVQHEYGIFGGKAGSHVLALLREVRAPIVTTLHTILGTPTADQRRVMDEIARLSTRLVVMSRYGAELLQKVHGVHEDKIDLIPHGIPSFPRARASKAQLGVEGKAVILTFGLLSPDKGIEYVIQALPHVVERHPNAIYVVVGATHPHVKERSGDGYRRSLVLLAQRLGVEANIIFHDRFVSHSELVEFLSAADIYVTPYLNPEQITSGTLAYAVGAGKAVISTPYHYATELLADRRGIVVPSRDPSALAQAIVGLLDHPDELSAYGDRAAAYGRAMEWPSVARSYLETLDRARDEHAAARRTVFEARTLATRPMDVPELELGHLRLMTDDTGVLQHAIFSIPRREDGYCLDDNARALLLLTLLEEAGATGAAATRALSSRYLAFVSHAFNPASGRFRNFMTYSRAWTERSGSEDSHGRALWALGAVVGRSSDPGRQSLAGQLFHAGLAAASSLESPRGWAFSLLGIDEYLRAFQGDSGVEALRGVLAERLMTRFHDNGASDWRWCEEVVAYDNARLPQALFVSGARMGNSEMIATGIRALEWLSEIQRGADGCFAPIGSNGFYRRGSQKAAFDQQPLEACAMVSACLDAWRITGDARWASEMRWAFRWFLGDNQLRLPVYDQATGGCRDGLHADRANMNEGAESTLSFLLAHADMSALDAEARLNGSILTAPAASAPRPTA